MDPFEKDHSLLKKLEAWTVDPHVPSGFQREVWQKIALKNAVQRKSVRHHLAGWLESLLASPRYATVLILASAFLGVGIAHVEAMNSNSKSMRNLETRYVGSIDPYQHISTR